MLKIVRQLWGGDPSREVLWATMQSFGARLVGQAAGFVVTVLAARTLGPGSFGLYSFMLISATLLAQVPGTGLDMSAVRVSARYWGHDPARARGVLVVAGTVKAGWVGLVATLMFVGARPLADTLFERPELALPLYYAAIVGWGLAATEFCTAVLQAREHFGRILVVNSAIAVLELGPVLVLVMVGNLSLTRCFMVFLAATLLGVVVSGLAVRQTWDGPASWNVTVVREVAGFGGWFMLAALLGTLANSLDILMLTRLAGPAATGVYASARSLALPIAIVGGALAAVLVPKFARVAAQAQLGPYVRQISPRIVGATVILTLMAVVLAPRAVPLVFGRDYRAAIGVFQLLTLAYGLQIVTWLVLAVLMALDRPAIIAGLNLVFLGMVALGYSLVVGRYGALGAAAVLAAGYAVLLIPFTIIALRLLQHNRLIIVVGEPAGQPSA